MRPAIIRISPPEGSNVPRMEMDDALCPCSVCRNIDRDQRPNIDVTPFACSDPTARARGEPEALLTYGGISVRIGLAYLHDLVGTILSGGPTAADQVLALALRRIEERMWDDSEKEKKKKDLWNDLQTRALSDSGMGSAPSADRLEEYLESL